MRPLIPLTGFLATSVLLVGCAASNHPLARQSPSVALQVTQMAGCYQLVDGGSHLPEGFPESPVILLDSIPAFPDKSPMIMFASVLTADSVAPPATTLSVWVRIDPPDVNLIHIWLSNGSERSGLTLRRTADTLAGSVRRVADFPKVFLSHRARAIRVRCPE
jgi:hypothetical protein